MGVTKFGFDDVRARLEQTAAISDEDMLMRLSYIGEAMCNHARTITRGHSTGGYDDQTGNLRSSIGYRIFKDGHRIQDGGFKSESGGNGEGEARTALDNFSRNAQKQGWTLLIVAGMNYAQYVEDKGYNVLHLTKLELEKEIDELKKKLGL